MRDKFQTKENFYIILDYYDDNLNNFVEEKSKFEKKIFPPNLIKKIFEQLNLVFKELKNNNFYHNRIFPNNILIKYSNEEKTNFDSCLTDYGLKRNDEECDLDKTTYGTNNFWIDGLEYKYKKKSSLLSIGITIYYLYFGFSQIKKEFPKMIKGNFKIEEDKKLEDLLKNLLKENPDEILTWEEYFNHPFFKQYEY